jgi:hypothetical protein
MAKEEARKPFVSLPELYARNYPHISEKMGTQKDIEAHVKKRLKEMKEV